MAPTRRAHRAAVVGPAVEVDGGVITLDLHQHATHELDDRLWPGDADSQWISACRQHRYIYSGDGSSSTHGRAACDTSETEQRAAHR